ncbi:MAG TPA: hypothetical protein P5119_10290 [Candidatus Aminicenantes bacterium]|nr:hypothetical protein [Candidatus Aminicenantes bacterium]HRY65712.1 hypothetical protein [Candidatus Aminicenantes bacterium]HRZ72626.1 hypothetical protein [Candidatus Aminicenantes bacterium]
MKKVALILVLFGCLAAPILAESKHNIGVGVILGEPTGLSFKLWSKQTVAWDAGAAWSFVNGGYLQVHSDFLLHNFSLFKVETGRMSLFYGLGGRVKFADDTTVSIRVPVGLAYEFEKTPVEIFVEVVPMLDLIPATEFQMAGAVGFRYYF